MANEPVTTVTGNVVNSDIEVRTAGNTRFLNFRIASTPRTMKNGDWVDGTTLFLNVTAFNDHAENIANAIRKGSTVTVTGRLQQRDWQDKEGNKRSQVELVADEVALTIPKFKSNESRSGRQASVAQAASTDDDIPF